MRFTEAHITGFIAGLGAAGLGFYLYKRNQDKVDAWLRKQGIKVPASRRRDPAAMNLEELVLEKEQLEDLIAEREMEEQKAAAEEPATA
jgi:hypothetical protein